MSTSERSLLESILSCPAAPYHEARVAQAVVDALKAIGLKPWRDQFGNILVKHGSGSGIAFDAHLDHPGVGFLRRAGSGRFHGVHARRSAVRHEGVTLGGVPEKMLQGAKVLLDGETAGTIVRVGKRTARGWAVEIQSSAQSATFAVWDVPACSIRGDHVHARAADDLAGVAAIVALMARLVKSRAKTCVWGIFPRAEEVGFAGATALASHNILPKSLPIISLEASSVRPGIDLGGGPVIRVGDRRAIFDSDLTRLLVLTAEKSSLPHRRALLDGGVCHATAYGAHGYRAGALAVPIRNYHNGGPGRIAAEIFSLKDWRGLINLMEALSRAWPRRRDLLTRDHAALLARMKRISKQRSLFF